jgi:tetratricopeptide (TPR) repeat protein
VNYFSGDRAAASADAELGLRIQPNDPGLLELRGLLEAASGDLLGAIDSFNLAEHWGAFDRIHLEKAVALESVGQDLAALREWTLALRGDPELPEGYLGRARLAIRLKKWDLALADLEQASTWAESDPLTELAIVASYLRCLPSAPDRLPRWLALAARTLGDFRALVAAK